MWGFPPSMRIWLERIEAILRRSGVTPKGVRAMICPQEPEREAESNESQGLHRLTNAYVS